MVKIRFRQILESFCYVFLALSLAFCAFTSYIKFSYPLAYGEEIRNYSDEFMLEANLVRAIIKVESGYNAHAESKKGAVGLMQIMPKTAEWIASELGEEDFDKTMLNCPKVNIRFGCFYLNYLSEKYDSIDKVLFAYNAGEGTLLKTMDANNFLDLESLDIEETRSYIYKVKHAMEKYEKFYNLR